VSAPLSVWQIGTGQNIIVIKGAKSAIPMGHESIIIRYFDTPKPHSRSPLAILQAEASHRHILPVIPANFSLGPSLAAILDLLKVCHE
jgi:hypothetical protein